MNHSDDEIMTLFFSVATISRYSSGGVRGLSAFIGQYRCMRFLQENGAVDRRRLTQAMDIRPASLSELLSKLEKKGFIVKIRSEEDRRCQQISLTERGARELQDIRKRQTDFHRSILSPLADEEKEQFYRILKKLKQAARTAESRGEERSGGSESFREEERK